MPDLLPWQETRTCCVCGKVGHFAHHCPADRAAVTHVGDLEDQIQVLQEKLAAMSIADNWEADHKKVEDFLIQMMLDAVSECLCSLSQYAVLGMGITYEMGHSGQHFHIPVQLIGKQLSGATTTCISQQFVVENCVVMRKLNHPIPLYNIVGCWITMAQSQMLPSLNFKLVSIMSMWCSQSLTLEPRVSSLDLTGCTSTTQMSNWMQGHCAWWTHQPNLMPAQMDTCDMGVRVSSSNRRSGRWAQYPWWSWLRNVLMLLTMLNQSGTTLKMHYWHPRKRDSRSMEHCTCSLWQGTPTHSN